ncbi:hypothetical protein HPB49_009506 [Dermacentor silvarum]|uniref:Uncharacterized protein n=1 Tax=Dermacentor silvarum TaxID=543639 RepID=A0ACB8DC41_DERSI|nr:hypothetical protein HPB49_009506 [Dermacentor silvarum]
MSPQDAVAGDRVPSISDLACVYLQAVAPEDQRGKDLCDSIANVAVQLAKLFQAMNGSGSYIGDNQPVLLKNPELLIVIKTLIRTMPEHVYRYVGFHATAYLSPFLLSKEALWELSLFAAARQMPRRKLKSSEQAMGRVVDDATLDAVVGRVPPRKWRLCLHIVDRLLPGMLVVAYARATNDTALFMELMADVIAEEVRSTFIDQVGRMAYFDNWTRLVFWGKARTTNLYSLFPLRQFFHEAVLDYAKQVQTKLQNVNSSLDIFLKASAFVGSMWSGPKHSILEEQRYASTLFNTDCLHWPQHDTVENFYNPFTIYWMRETTEALKAKEDCFAKQYRANDYDFQQRLFTKRYLSKDYRLESLNMTADQLFFIYYTLVH